MPDSDAVGAGSRLEFLRRTPRARATVERLYLADRRDTEQRGEERRTAGERGRGG